MESIQKHYESLWQSCLVQVKQCTNEEEYSRLFKPLQALDFTNQGVLRLMVPSESYAKQIEENYVQLLAPIVKNTFGQYATISYVFPSAPQNNTNQIYNTSQNDGKGITNPFIIPGIKRVKFDSQLRFEYNFNNFIEGECNRLVRSAGMAISVNPGGANSFNPLFVHGGSGMGKTHIGQAIGNEITARFPETKVLYVSANRFQSQFQYAAQHSELSDFIQFYQMIDVLIIDDIQEFAGKAGTQNIFFNIFNHLHMLGKQLIMTSDRPQIELKDIEERLITRFKWGLTAEIQPPDLATRIAIINHKAKQLNLKINESTINYIATNVTSNVRELEGSITSLNAQCKLIKREPSIELARMILRDIVDVKSSEVTTDKIIQAVCNYYNIDQQTLLSKTRTRHIATARQIAMYICKTHASDSLTDIGKLLGGKSHATVLYACKTIINLISTDKTIKMQVEDIERKLQF